MVEQSKETRAPDINQGLYLVQQKDGTQRMHIGSIDDVIKAYLGGAKSVRWRPEEEVKRILVGEEEKNIGII